MVDKDHNDSKQSQRQTLSHTQAPNTQAPSNQKWEKQKAALKKVQISFELAQSVDQQIRIEAAKSGESPSNVIRRVLGLEVSPPVRPRLGVSLSQAEIENIAAHYNADPKDRKAWMRKAAQTIQEHYAKQAKISDQEKNHKP